MRRLIAILFALSMPLACAAPPRVALVRVTDIYSSLLSTKTEQADIRKRAEGIYDDQRAVELRKVIDDLNALNAERNKIANDPGSDFGRREKVSREYEMKRLGMETLQRDFEAFKNERTLEINRQMVLYMRASLNRITAEAKAIAAQKGYDLLVDSSGNSNSTVPVLLYAKNAPDLTDEIFAVLQPPGSGESASTRPADASKPGPATPNTPSH